MKKKAWGDLCLLLILCMLVVVFLAPIFFVVMNSFKGKLSQRDPEDGFSDGLWLFAFCHGVLRAGDSAVYFHDSLLSDPGKGEVYGCIVLYICIFHDRAFSDGDVYHVQAGKYISIE